MSDDGLLNKLILQPSYYETVTQIRKIRPTVTRIPNIEKHEIPDYQSGIQSSFALIESKTKHELDPGNGASVAGRQLVAGYDESKQQFLCLEGSALFTCHSLAVMGGMEYIPANLLTLYFYTRSKRIFDECRAIKYVEDPREASNLDYVVDRNQFLLSCVPKNSILLVDGPLLGGNISAHTLRLAGDLLAQQTYAVFIIKNSDSNLVTQNLKELRGLFNSDLHWAYHYLHQGDRTAFFKYRDEVNPDNAKVFCYLKALDLSPQRVEFDLDTFQAMQPIITDVMDMIYYLFLVQGDPKNSQVRPIAVAELFAREVLRIVNPYEILRSSGLVPTMNQERFGG